MAHPPRHTHFSPLIRRQRRRSRRSVAVLLVLLVLWSLCLGIGLAQATEPDRSIPAIAQTTPPEPTPSATPPATSQPPIGTVDAVPQRYKLGEELYLSNCATCHIAPPPAVMPSETWRQLLQDPQHYGEIITPLVEPSIQIAWRYLRDYSRPLAKDEEIPYRIYQSRYFKLLHPDVEFPQRVNLKSCVSCHPGAGQYNFRQLSAEWQNAP